jgi:hypothetical protein
VHFHYLWMDDEPSRPGNSFVHSIPVAVPCDVTMSVSVQSRLAVQDPFFSWGFKTRVQRSMTWFDVFEHR